MPRSQSTSGLGGNARRVRLACLPLIAAPLLFGVPVALGIVVSFVRLVGVRFPDLGWATTVNSDAEELYLGHTLYQSPAHGYTGQIYTPLFPTIVSLFDRLYLWNGWALVVVILASSSLALLGARIAYDRAPRAPRALSLAAAAGVGLLAYWCVASVKLALLDEARSDQLAWAFALYGLVAVADLGPAPPRRRVVVAVLLLTAALWTKQTTVAVVAPAFAWVLALALFLAIDRKAALLFGGLLCAVNLALLLILNLLTHGWEFYINFEVATLQATEFTYRGNFIKGLQCTAVAAGFVAATWLGSAIRAAFRTRRPPEPGRRRSRRELVGGWLRAQLAARDPTARRILLLGLYIVVGFPLALYFMLKQGTETNQLIGVVWALGLFAAAGWRVAQRHLPVAVAAGGCVALLFVLVQLGPVNELAARADVTLPAFEEAVQWPPMPEELLAYAKSHTIYTYLFSDLNVPNGGPLYPNYYNFADLLAAGNQPLWLVHALLERRFDAVTYFPLEGDPYTSANGKWEENYLWKLDEVIAARYAPQPGLPAGLLGRRPGPEQAAWMRDCFGPFTAGGTSFRIHRGGGFWCSFTPGSLELVRAPVALSEVVTKQPVHARGAITVSLEDRPTDRIELELEGGSGAGWSADVAPAPGKPGLFTVATYANGGSLGDELVSAQPEQGGWRGIQLTLTPTHGSPGAPTAAGAHTLALTTPASAAPFALVAASGAAVDLRGLRLTR